MLRTRRVASTDDHNLFVTGAAPQVKRDLAQKSKEVDSITVLFFS